MHRVGVGVGLGGPPIHAFVSAGVGSIPSPCPLTTWTPTTLHDRDNPDIMTFKARPDYRTCVALVTAAALQEMVLPGLLAVGLPVAVGLVFRFIGSLTDRPMLGAEVLMGYLR